MAIAFASPSILLFIILLAYRLALVIAMAESLQGLAQYMQFIQLGILTTTIVELSENKLLKKYSLSILIATRLIDHSPNDATWYAHQQA